MKRFFFICIVGWFLFVAGISHGRAETFAVISDVRAAALDKALEFIRSQGIDLILLPGDFCYDGQAYYPHFKKYGFGVDPEKAPGSQNLYFTIGNHDAPPSGDKTFTEAIAPWYPQNGPATAPKGTIFSFDRGNCHFVITNPYWRYPAGGYTDAQLEWLEQDLKSTNQPFNFIFGHEPAFPLSRHVGDSLDQNPENRDRFWKILSENGGQAFFCGHTHNLSHVLKDGVYQIDAGEVRGGGPVCVTLVEVTADKATVRSYQSGGGVPVPETDDRADDDLVMQTDIYKAVQPSNAAAPEVLYSAGTGSEGSGSTCFIRAMRTDDEP